MVVLGIESSCDETGVAIYETGKGIIADVLYSQIAIHQQYGGVVPEIASRNHISTIVGLVDNALNQANLKKTALNAVAYTAGPGLIGALLTGASFAKSLAFGLQIPALAIHHLEAHLLAALLDSPALNFPFLALLISGGHTQLIEAKALGQYTVLGETLDDAVGEAFDKTAKLLGLAYPGGAKLAQLAGQYQADVCGVLPAFPRPMTDRPGLNFSFSGLKTHALTCWLNSAKKQTDKIAIAYAFQQAVVETLVIKCQRALLQVDAKKLVVAGGVAANHALRIALNAMVKKNGGEIFFPQLAYCTDNGAMVAYAGWLRLKHGEKDLSHAVEVRARWPLV